ncbi:hypothetical protein CYMTET_23394 [Cymbomonas tetramitiformis]|uniref:Uncharacterized protein n=1 Tax=Cymbomonas tetramitiformis TaxID=36881 RepID=A0AAE0L190_9CHLO|nr:hypothetical protein CYMTET_23394 [Cymbomonas tetramitiformis]
MDTVAVTVPNGAAKPPASKESLPPSFSFESTETSELRREISSNGGVKVTRTTYSFLPANVDGGNIFAPKPTKTTSSTAQPEDAAIDDPWPGISAETPATSNPDLNPNTVLGQNSIEMAPSPTDDAGQEEPSSESSIHLRTKTQIQFFTPENTRPPSSATFLADAHSVVHLPNLFASSRGSSVSSPGLPQESRSMPELPHLRRSPLRGQSRAFNKSRASSRGRLMTPAITQTSSEKLFHAEVLQRRLNGPPPTPQQVQGAFTYPTPCLTRGGMNTLSFSRTLKFSSERKPALREMSEPQHTRHRVSRPLELPASAVSRFRQIAIFARVVLGNGVLGSHNRSMESGWWDTAKCHWGCTGAGRRAPHS